MTLIDIVTDTLRQITVIGQTATPSAEQGQDAVTKYNDLMADLEEDGIDLGHYPKATTADTVELPAGTIAGIKALLGVRLCDGYGIPVPPVVATVAMSGYRRMLGRAIYGSQRETRTDAPHGDAQPYSPNILTGQ